MPGKGRQRRSTTAVGDFALRLHLAVSARYDRKLFYEDDFKEASQPTNDVVIELTGNRS